MDRGGEVVVPWEHWVCSQCLWENPHAVWLIKLRCFKPHQHRHQYGALVSIEPSAMRLVEMRHPPPNIERNKAPIRLCQARQYCQRKYLCQFPHSEVEYHTWDFIRKVFKGKDRVGYLYYLVKTYGPADIELHSCHPLPVDRQLRELLCTSRLVPQCPSTEVCAKCYESAAQSDNTRWLTWLECGQLPGHEEENGVTLIVGTNNKVTNVTELPPSLYGCHPQQLAFCERLHRPGGCPDGNNCNRAHSIEELEYWKWSLVHGKLEQVLANCTVHN